MPLPRLIEFIESLQRPTGGTVAEHGVGQLIYASLRPHRQLRVNLTPNADEYAAIGYKLIFSPSMVPYSLNITAQWAEHTPFNGTLTDTIIQEGLDSYVVVTEEAPFQILLVNSGEVAQGIELHWAFAMVRVEEDYDYILKALDDLYNREMRQDVKNLYQLMLEAKKAPPPLVPAPPAPPGGQP